VCDRRPVARHRTEVLSLPGGGGKMVGPTMLLIRVILAVLLLFLPGAELKSQQAGDRKQEIGLHAQRAQRLLSEKHPDQAIPEFRAILALDPGNVDAHANLGVLLFFRGEYASAIPEFQAALKLRPKLWKIQALLGMAQKRLGNVGESVTNLESSFPELEEKDVQIQMGMELVEIYSGRGELDKAARTVDFLRIKYPTDVGVLYASYRIHSDLAAESMLSLSLVAPHSGQMHQIMAHELARQGQMEAAAGNFREALRIDPKLPGIHFELAEALNASDIQAEKAEAKHEYETALSLNPSDEKSECRLGAIAYQAGDLQGSLSHYSRAAQLQPDDPEALLGLAKGLLEMKETQKAQGLLEHAVQVDPASAEAHYRLASVYRMQGKMADAKRELEEYQKFKAMKEKLKRIYQEMRVQPVKRDSEEAESR
jgi:cytochrome c-type biogenesis protein CcmH/NrfG